MEPTSYLAALLRSGRDVTADHIARMYQRKRQLIEAALADCALDDALRPTAFYLGCVLRGRRIIKTLPPIFDAAA